MERHRTIECRLHAGTTNAEKIINWIKLLVAIYTYAIKSYNSSQVRELFDMETSEEKINKAWDLVGLTSKERAYFNARIQKFMIPDLANMQKSAKQYLEFRPLKDRIYRRYDKASRALEEIRQQDNNLLRAFGQVR